MDNLMISELVTQHLWFMYLALGLFSLCVGSLLNVVIYRLPIMLRNEWREQCCELLTIEQGNKEQSINLFFPRSFCPECNTLVSAGHNIPLLSYLFLKGKCATCKTTIPRRYPFIEALTLALSLYAAWHFGFTLQLSFVLLALWMLICLFFIDLDHQLLPDSLTLSLLWLGLIANTQNLFTSLPLAVLSAAGAYLSLWLFIKIFYLITGKIGMGNGDFKLFAAFGAWFGWIYLPFILLMASIAGAVIGLIYLRCNNQTTDTAIPFGPFLCCAGIITLFWGKSIVTWYLGLLIH